ncbi:hypothetical protein ACFTAO_50910 [Paenibacillus rhizoplanae]
MGSRVFLDNKELENAYYGEGYCVSHEKMERSYLPFAAHVLFPREKDSDSFRRFFPGKRSAVPAGNALRVCEFPDSVHRCVPLPI